ncbi:MAG: mechanosensitive ion channel [Chitinivibrionales bacterium]|nr:mechanosensitive ion channel [Chitinivibrionales bacterium]
MEEWLTSEFWQSVGQDIIERIIIAAPSFIIICVVAVAALKALKFSLVRIKKLMYLRIEKSNNIDVVESQKRTDTLIGILGTSLRIVIWAMILMLLLKKLGIDIAPLIAGAGIAGLAVGFGAQELVRDIISGFFMLLENQIRTGDVAILNGTGGLVENVGLRTTVLRDLSGVVHVFQNGKINSLSNMTKEWSAMVFDIGVAYKEDTDIVTNIMIEIADEMKEDPEYKDKIIAPIEIFGVDSFSDSAVVVKARLKTKPIMQWAVGREYRRRLKKIFDERGIEIPFPHRTIYWGEEINPLMVKNQENQNTESLKGTE